MSDKHKHNAIAELRVHLRRREFLKAAGVGITTSVVGAGTVTAQPDRSNSIASGPVSVSYSAETVEPANLPTPTIPNDPDIIGEGSGEAEEMPRGGPNGGGGGGGSSRKPQTGTTGSGLSVVKEFDGFTTRDVVRGIDFDDDGTVEDSEIIFSVPSDNQLATGPSHHVTAINSEIGFIKKGVPENGEDRQGGMNDPEGGADDYITHYRLEDFFESVLSLSEGTIDVNGDGKTVADEDGDDADSEPDPFQFENTQVFDPRARFDPNAGENGRFYVACVEFNLPDTKPDDDGERVENGDSDATDENESVPVDDLSDLHGAFLLAVSSSANPNDPWTIYRIPPQNNFGLVDYPTLGYGGDAVYLSQNFFALTQDGFAFTEATLTVLNKDDLLAGRDVDGWEFGDLRNPDGSLAFTLQPAAMPETGGPFHLANSRFGHGKTITVWDVTVPEDFSEPSIDNGAIRVASYANAPAAQQPDSDKKIDTLDTRLMNLAYGDGTLWMAHTIAPGHVRWYEIDPSGPTLVQAREYRRENWATFLPTVESNGDSMVMVHNVSAEQEYTGVETAGRTDGYDAGELQDHAVVQPGEVAYNYDDTKGGGPGGETNVLRWGDYNGVAVDPVDGSYWVIGQYAKDPTPEQAGPTESELYGTRIANVTIN